MPRRRVWSIGLVLTALSLVTRLEGVYSEREAFAVSFNGDVVADGSPEARGMLRVARTASREALSTRVRLQSRAVQSLLDYRAGSDGIMGTRDDGPLQTLPQLDALPGVGVAALSNLLRYAQENGLVTRGIRVNEAPSISNIPRAGPEKGAYRVHLIDVGTGLAILVQGYDFNVLFDGGSADDSSGISSSGNRSRLLSYLYAALGPSGPSECEPLGDRWLEHPNGSELSFNHLFLSHPHADHGSLLDETLHCYRVENVWDAGVVNDTTFYRQFMQEVAAEARVSYNTAAEPPLSRTITVDKTRIPIPLSARWSRFRAGDQQSLGWRARMKVLHANGERQSDLNQNSIVLRIDLGGIGLLLVGDAESGPRLSPSAPPGDVEAYLLANFSKDLDVDILQVGHHGSLTSSRMRFLEAVSPQFALVGAGPKSYAGVVLPDYEVIEALDRVGATILRTDLNDRSGCPVVDRVGVDNRLPGGCDNFILEIDP